MSARTNPVSAQKLRRRTSRTVPASITALVLTVAGAALVWLGVAALTGDTSLAEATLAAATTVTWGSVTFYAVAAGAALIGLVLLLAAVLPGRRTFLTAGSGWDGMDGTTTVIGRSSVERFAAARAEQVDGVSSASCRLRGSRLKLSVTSHLVSTADLQRTVRNVVQSSVDTLGLKLAPKVTTSVRTAHDD